jgi:thiosulfate/3-mercaptopyruvate sulfurtransferase
MNELSSNTKNKNSKNNYDNIKYKTLDIICDADTLRSLIRKNEVRVVDVRKAQDYLLEHIPTAVSLPLARL